MDEQQFLEHIQNVALIPILDRIGVVRGALADLARTLESKYGLPHAKQRLAELRTGKRKLTLYYLAILMDGGIMTIDDILQGRKIEELKDAERDIAMRFALTQDEILQAYNLKLSKAKKPTSAI